MNVEELAQMMLDEQERQGYRRDPSVFMRDLTSGRDRCGFSWELSEKGIDYWRSILGFGADITLKMAILREFDRLFIGESPKETFVIDNETFVL